MNLDMLPEVLAYLLSLVAGVDPGALALATLGAGLAWRAVRRLRPTAKALFPLTRWLRRKSLVATVSKPGAKPTLACRAYLYAALLGLPALALDLAILPFCALAGIRARKRSRPWEPDETAEAFAAIHDRVTRAGERLVALEEHGYGDADPDGHWPPLERRVYRLECRTHHLRTGKDGRILLPEEPDEDPIPTPAADFSPIVRAVTKAVERDNAQREAAHALENIFYGYGVTNPVNPPDPSRAEATAFLFQEQTAPPATWPFPAAVESHAP